MSCGILAPLTGNGIVDHLALQRPVVAPGFSVTVPLHVEGFITGLSWLALRSSGECNKPSLWVSGCGREKPRRGGAGAGFLWSLNSGFSCQSQ